MGHQAASKAEVQRQGGTWKSGSLPVPGCALRHLQATTVVPGSYKASSANALSLGSSPGSTLPSCELLGQCKVSHKEPRCPVLQNGRQKGLP